MKKKWWKKQAKKMFKVLASAEFCECYDTSKSTVEFDAVAVANATKAMHRKFNKKTEREFKVENALLQVGAVSLPEGSDH